mgnify:CR=1 FL=1
MMGKLIRMERILDRNTRKTVIVPLDHGVTVGPIKGLIAMGKTVDMIAEGGANAVIGYLGLPLHGHRGAGLVETRIQRLQRLQHRGAGDLDVDIELGGAVLQRLEFTDQFSELLALLETGDGAAEHFLAEPHPLPRHRRAADL